MRSPHQHPHHQLKSHHPWAHQTLTVRSREDCSADNSDCDSDDPQACCIMSCSSTGYELLSGCVCRPQRWMCRSCFTQLRHNKCPFCKADIPAFDGVPVPRRDHDERLVDPVAKPLPGSTPSPSKSILSAGQIPKFIMTLLTLWQHSDPHPVLTNGQVRFWDPSVAEHAILPESDSARLISYNNIIRQHLPNLDITGRRFEQFVIAITSGSLNGLIGSGARARSRGDLVREGHELKNQNLVLSAAAEVGQVQAANTIARLQMQLKQKDEQLKRERSAHERTREQLKRNKESLAIASSEQGQRQIAMEYCRSQIFGSTSPAIALLCRMMCLFSSCVRGS
jgi:hypothetical protein